MRTRRTSRVAIGVQLMVLAAAGTVAPRVFAAEPAAPISVAQLRGTVPVAHFDVSPALRDLPPLMPLPPAQRIQIRKDDWANLNAGAPGQQTPDGAAQDWLGTGIPEPFVSFDALANVAGFAPPDTIGDIGPDHYVAMSNVHFAVYSRTGTPLLGPLANNTLWTGFGGPCQSENAGDPIILYDQLADRWLLTQFTSLGPTYYNCVALSVTGDPTGQYFRWAFTTGPNFPDYPKYGVWTDAYYISTREFGPSGFVGVGAYAVNRLQMLAGNPSPTVISFLAPPVPNESVGDGLLPADIDGYNLPAPGSPGIFVGSMDDGGPYTAPADALTVWRFVADFASPANSSFILTHTLPTTAFDTIFGPCGGTRSCIPQPGTVNRIDILSYRQRPMHRLAYRRFATHEALVTNQSVEGAPSMAGVRWWELRDPFGTPAIFQEGTYVPGSGDGIHRWMGSAALDADGNLGLGYSASSASVFPSIRYTGRLAGDPLGTLPLGEGTIVTGTGSQTAGESRWGDYSSLNVDPVDDCSLWYVNEYLPVTSLAGWQLRVGGFRLSDTGCTSSDFAIVPNFAHDTICVGNLAAQYAIDVKSINGYTNSVTLGVTGNPGATTVAIGTNPVTPPASDVSVTLNDTGALAAGDYTFEVTGTGTGSLGHAFTLGLTVVEDALGAPTLSAPADGATAQPLRPLFSWTAVAGAGGYEIEVDDNADFSTPLLTEAVASTSFRPALPLAPLTTYYWRVTPTNVCGDGATSAEYDFTTFQPAPTLVIDDNTAAPDNLPTIQALLTGAGETWDVWNVQGLAGEPAAVDLSVYQRVIMFSGDDFGSAGPGPETETAFAAWLDAGLGRCLFLDSQDYLFDYGVTSFGTNYLGVASHTDDVSHTTATGKNFFTGGPYALAFPGGFSNWSDLVIPTSTALLAFEGSGGDAPGGASLYKDGGDWRTVFFTVPIEAFPAASRQAVFNRVLQLCDAIHQSSFEFTNLGDWDDDTNP